MKYSEIRAMSTKDRKGIFDFAIRRSRVLQSGTTEINDMVDEWHESNSSLELHEWLGMSSDEYARFVEKGELP